MLPNEHQYLQFRCQIAQAVTVHMLHITLCHTRRLRPLLPDVVSSPQANMIGGELARSAEATEILHEHRLTRIPLLHLPSLVETIECPNRLNLHMQGPEYRSVQRSSPRELRPGSRRFNHNSEILLAGRV